MRTFADDLFRFNRWCDRHATPAALVTSTAVLVWHTVRPVVELFVDASEHGFYTGWSVLLFVTISLGAATFFTRPARKARNQLDDMASDIDAAVGMQTRSAELLAERHMSERRSKRREWNPPQIVFVCFIWCTVLTIAGSVYLGF